MNIVKRIHHAIMKRRNPLGYAKLIGVNFPWGGVHLYGNIDWSTEPWIITLGLLWTRIFAKWQNYPLDRADLIPEQE